jgi:hypothetical protein
MFQHFNSNSHHIKQKNFEIAASFIGAAGIVIVASGIYVICRLIYRK